MSQHDNDREGIDRASGDEAELDRLQALLAPYGAAARGLRERMPPMGVPPARQRARWALRALCAGLAACALAWAGQSYRFGWSENRAWSYARDGEIADSDGRLVPGQTLSTGPGQALRLRVARIGRIELSPDSRLQLLRTGADRHRVRLQQGHLRARIWAPPERFAVASGPAEVVDLGCDFDVWRNRDGSGRVYVRSGWVAYRVGAREVLVPGGYGLRFDESRAYAPLRPRASAPLVAAVDVLQGALSRDGSESTSVRHAADAVAAAAQDRDAFTLLSLLSEYPTLARGPLYPRLAAALGADPGDRAHRAAWQAGDHAAIDAWWRRLPAQPKQWWRNWSDALP